ncbi:glycosyltransferase [Alteromonas stellipolaris]|uniref:glycosyltransferase family 2 protein n=1 Tax=Alteromonas stellipolaris TaxID=233316 RepID=UPI002119AE66|nr:glycosyltransferase [Alteromonas stellipolaris]MCQ8847217.1 glycosyltransferase [Alteromonas stellipolaris]
MASEQPLISVVMPVYNAQNYILDALKSICDQTYQNLEIIVIDDGSTDSSKELIQSIADIDNRLKLISRENKGLISSLNEGIEVSKGQYIARMDADDLSHPERLSRQIDYLEKHPEVGVIFSGIEYIDEYGKIIRKKISSKTRAIEPVELLFGCPVCHPTAMFNMNKVTKIEIRYDHNFKNAEDFELWTRIISAHSISIMNEVLFQYRIHSGSITSQNSDSQRKMAVNAIVKNLSSLSNSKKLKRYFFVVYNNHQGNESRHVTLNAIAFLFIRLKFINYNFSLYKYATKSYYLVRDKLKSSKKVSLRAS